MKIIKSYMGYGIVQGFNSTFGVFSRSKPDAIKFFDNLEDAEKYFDELTNSLITAVANAPHWD